MEPHTESLLLRMLPDSILVHIGTLVAELCGLRDFVSFSIASKRFHGLLLGSKHTVTEVIRLRKASVEQQGLVSSNGVWLPSYSLRSVTLRTLEELDLFESLEKLNFLTENRICTSPNLERDNRVRFEYSDLEICNNDGDEERRTTCIRLIHAIRKLLRNHPRLSVVLDAHCGTQTQTKSAWMYSHVRGLVVLEAIVSGLDPVATDKRIRMNLPTTIQTNERVQNQNLEQRIGLRAWGERVSKIVSGFKEHPYRDTAQEGKGWIEVYFRMDDPEMDTPLVLPPRPSYYNKVAQEYYNEQNGRSQ